MASLSSRELFLSRPSLIVPCGYSVAFPVSCSDLTKAKKVIKKTPKKTKKTQKKKKSGTLR